MQHERNGGKLCRAGNRIHVDGEKVLSETRGTPVVAGRSSCGGAGAERAGKSACDKSEQIEATVSQR